MDVAGPVAIPIATPTVLASARLSIDRCFVRCHGYGYARLVPSVAGRLAGGTRPDVGDACASDASAAGKLHARI